MSTLLLVRGLKDRDHWGGPDVNGRMILKLMLKTFYVKLFTDSEYIRISSLRYIKVYYFVTSWFFVLNKAATSAANAGLMSPKCVMFRLLETAHIIHCFAKWRRSGLET